MPSAKRSDSALVTICCKCGRLKGKDGWQQESVEAAEHFSHGYCPDCFQKVEKILADRAQSSSGSASACSSRVRQTAAKSSG